MKKEAEKLAKKEASEDVAEIGSQDLVFGDNHPEKSTATTLIHHDTNESI